MFVGSGKVTPVGPPVARVGDAVPVDLLHGLLEHAERGGGISPGRGHRYGHEVLELPEAEIGER